MWLSDLLREVRLARQALELANTLKMHELGLVTAPASDAPVDAGAPSVSATTDRSSWEQQEKDGAGPDYGVEPVALPGPPVPVRLAVRS